jgi:hypothetical protein
MIMLPQMELGDMLGEDPVLGISGSKIIKMKTFDNSDWYPASNLSDKGVKYQDSTTEARPDALHPALTTRWLGTINHISHRLQHKTITSNALNLRRQPPNIQLFLRARRDSLRPFSSRQPLILPRKVSPQQ